MVKTAMTRVSRGNGYKVSTETSQPTPTFAPTVFPDSNSLQITAHKLNGKNYLYWSHTIQMVIQDVER